MQLESRFIQNGDFEIRMMRPEDAPGVIALYRAVYGDHYPIESMYDPAHIIDQHDKGIMYRAVISRRDGVLVAHQALFRTEDTYAGLYENGHGIVRDEYRGYGLNKDIMDYIYKVLAPAVGVEVIWGEAVAHHIFMQKSAMRMGVKESGLELDLMPADSYVKEGSASGRVAGVIVFYVVREKLHTVFLPRQYEMLLRQVYAAAGLQREFAELPEHPAWKAGSRISHFYFPPAGVLRMTVYKAGEDAITRLQQIEQQYIEQGAAIMQVYIPMGKDWSGQLAVILNQQGYFYAGMLPRWFDEDGLMLQKILHEPNWADIQTYSELARDLLAFIRQDRLRVADLENQA